MDGFQVELLNRLPLAQAALKVFDYVFDSAALNGLFAEHRGRCFQKALAFDTLAHLVRDALVLHGGSGRRSFEAADQADALPVAYQNAYAKLGRLPLAVSMALLAQGSRRVEALLPPGQATQLPASLAGFEVVVFDGKQLKNAAKRLGALRGLPGKMLGGKLLVALSLASGLAIAMNADPDGERNDVPLVPGLVGQVRAQVAAAILWMGDRQFGDLNIAALLCERRGDHFLLRCTKTPGFYADPARPARAGIDGGGRRWVVEWGWLGGPKDPRRRYVRRITLYRPQEPDDIILITDLLDEVLYPATDLLAAYLQRWGIERMFQQVTEVFDLRRLIGSTPRAMIFQSAICLLLYNIVQVLRAHAASDAGKVREQVSTEKLFGDTRDQLKAWADLGDCAVACKLLPAENDPAAIATWLAQRMKGTWRDRWLKAPAKKRRPATPPAKVPKHHSGHTSVWRVLQAAKLQMQSSPRS
jgi:hypothetical protein